MFESGQILRKCFAPQNEPHTDKQSFSGTIFTEISKKLLFVVKKETIEERAKNYSESYFFSTSLKMVQILRNGFDLMQTFFLSNQ